MRVSLLCLLETRWKVTSLGEERGCYGKVELKSQFHSQHLEGSGRDVNYSHQVYMENTQIIRRPRERSHLWNVVSTAGHALILSWSLEVSLVR